MRESRITCQTVAFALVSRWNASTIASMPLAGSSLAGSVYQGYGPAFGSNMI